MICNLIEYTFDGFGFSPHLAYEDRTLDDGNAKFRQLLLVGTSGEMAFHFLLSNECGHSLRQSLEDYAEGLAGGVILFRELVSDDRERAAALHIELVEKCDVLRKGMFEISPGSKFRMEMRPSGLDFY